MGGSIHADLMSMKIRKKSGDLLTGAINLEDSEDGITDGLHVFLGTAGEHLNISCILRHGGGTITMKLREGYHPLEIKEITAISASAGTFEATPLYG